MRVRISRLEWKPFASAATRTRSVPARPRSTRSSASSPRPTAIRSTARRSTPTSRSCIAKLNSGEARERRARRRVAGAAEERGARVHVADQAPGHPVADLRRPGRLRAERAASTRSSRRRSTDKTLKTDLSALLPLVKGAGLVYLCNPNNPTATINSAQEIKDFIAEVKKTSPTTGDPDRRGVQRLRHRPVVRRPRFRSRSRRRTCSSRAPSRRPTAWPACASATRSATPRRSRSWRA